MSTAIYEVECWRDQWFYKIGSHYTGPFGTRQAAIESAEIDLAPALHRMEPNAASRRSVPYRAGALLRRLAGAVGR